MWDKLWSLGLRAISVKLKITATTPSNVHATSSMSYPKKHHDVIFG